MTNIQLLIRHSGIDSRQFRLGLIGKVAVEALSVLMVGVLFFWLLTPNPMSWVTVGFVAALILAVQWWVGQSAKYTFLGAYKITHGLRSQLLTDIRRQPLSVLRGKRLGEKVKLLTADLKQFEDIFSHLIADFISSWVVPLAMLFVVGFIHPILGIVTFAVFLLALSVLILFEKNFNQRAFAHHKTNIDVSSRLLEYVDCLPMLRGFAKTERLAKPLCDKIEQQRADGLGLEWAGGVGVLFATLMAEFTVVFNLGLVSFYLQDGQLSLSECLVVVVASVACVRPLTRMTVYAALLRYMLHAANRLVNIVQLPQQVVEGTPPSCCDVTVEDMHLVIDEQTVIDGININILEGQRVAFVGASGAGKSSLLDSIAAFHIPSSGSVKIGGLQVDEVGTGQWYKMVSYVTQDVQLLGGSLRDNLVLAKPDATEEEIESVVDAAGLAPLVAGLPKGIDSDVGENGNRLSGGERQRVSIARALLHDAPILLLDEFTSALDENTQDNILSTIDKLSRGKTVITVAHRLDTVRNMDAIYVLDHGKIVDSGTHETLITKHGRYQQLWQAGQKA
ncbi:ABC transporter ATP-binding protein [Vibrio hepatarius]|uniref:ABC transporter ATP-binding protein n=1 Tax=Vibrio hepatarius TaxID=171383 RepID=UPI001C08ED63|nr:ABC transporter ATP-binding protein [Vibrio hepatarius]MBU2898689.1 ABC transporter ATP-binding protein/permease [Vibrio hepatarius]